MSRVKGDLALRDVRFERMNRDSSLCLLCNVFLKLAIVDLWALWKVRRLLNASGKLLLPVIKITWLISLSTALLFVTLNGRMLNRAGDSILLLSDDSETCAANVEKELIVLKSKTLTLDATLRKLDEQLRRLQTLQEINNGVNAVELADFAAEAIGGSVVATPDTESFYETKTARATIFGIPLWKPSYFTPRKILQPWTQAGECWAFSGSHGKVEIELPYATIISHVTMEHVSASLSITGVVDFAPKSFTVWGKIRDTYVTIGTFTYNIYSSPAQTFPVDGEDFQSPPFTRILLEVSSNWGNPEYTCIYRFKVHGKLLDNASAAKFD